MTHLWYVYEMYLLPRAFFATTIDTYTMVYDRYLIMRIRFRGSDFGLVAKINIIIVRAKSKQASCAEMVLGLLFFVLL